MHADPAWFADRMERMLALLRDGGIAPPRRTVVSLAQAGEALPQALGQGRTIGKLVLRLPPTDRGWSCRHLPDHRRHRGGRASDGALAVGFGRRTGGAGGASCAGRPGCQSVAADVTDRDALASLLRTLAEHCVA